MQIVFCVLGLVFSSFHFFELEDIEISLQSDTTSCCIYGCECECCVERGHEDFRLLDIHLQYMMKIDSFLTDSIRELIEIVMR